MSYLANRIQPATLASSIAAPGILPGMRSWHAADCSIFGLAAQLSHALAARADDAIGLLLAAATLPPGGPPFKLPPGGTGPASSPVWAAEAMHRAYATLQLFLKLHQSTPLIDRLTRDLEYRLAADLASNLRALATADPRAPSACAPALRAVVGNLVALFGPATADLQVKTDIEPITLPGAARRALVLLAHELVADAVLHASAGHPGSRILVTLRPLSPGLACLTVTEDDYALSNEHRQPDTIATSLAALLLADLHYADRRAGYTTAVIFGVGGAHVQPQSRACRKSRQGG
jgi:two-component sensor histidine kinase